MGHHRRDCRAQSRLCFLGSFARPVVAGYEIEIHMAGLKVRGLVLDAEVGQSRILPSITARPCRSAISCFAVAFSSFFVGSERGQFAVQMAL